MSERLTKNTLEASFKSMDTEEPIDIYFYRPIGYQWARLFQKLGVHPNAVTIASIFIGVAAGIMFYPKDLGLNIIGMLLLIWANSYDSADGQLARMTGKKTQWGRMLDGFAGDLWFFSIYVSICLRLTPEWGIWIWLLGAFAGFICHTKQSSLADYYRNIHLYFLKGEAGSELDNFKQQREIFHSLPWKGNIWWKLFLYFYGNYTRSQENMSPDFQKFFSLVKDKYGKNIPQWLRDEFRELSKPLMKYTNILTFNVRAIVLFISLFIDMPWLYFVFEVTVMNILFFYMRYRHEQLSRLLYHKIKQERSEK